MRPFKSPIGVQSSVGAPLFYTSRWKSGIDLINIYMKCERCNKEFTEIIGSGRFCSRSCANARVRDRQTRQKISDGILQRIKTKGKWGVQNIKHPVKLSKVCPVCKNEFTTYKYYHKRIYCSRKCYQQDNKHEFRNSTSGGYRIGSGTGKHGYYNGFWCDSTYELAYLIYCLDHNIDIKRNTESFEYLVEGKKYKYYPDFIVNGKLVEIKGYFKQSVENKLRAVKNNGIQITILYKNDLESVFQYVTEKYKIQLRSLYTLYDNHKPLYQYICSNCNKLFTTEHKRKTQECFCSQQCAGSFRKKRNFIPV